MKKKIIYALVILFISAAVIFLIKMYFDWKNEIIIEPYEIDYENTLASAQEAVDLLSTQDYIDLNENIDLFFCKNKPYDMSPQKDGEVIERPPNRELFSTLYYNGFEQISSMYIDDTEIGLSFVKGRTYPEDYDYRGNKYHLEYGICFLYDDYTENRPDIKKDFRNSVKITYLENIYDNIYLYMAERDY